MPTTKDALTGDPLVSFNFEIKIEGKLSGYFTECSGLGSESEVTEHKIVGSGDRDFHEAKIITAQFFAERELSKANSLRRQVEAGAKSLMKLPEEAF